MVIQSLLITLRYRLSFCISGFITRQSVCSPEFALREGQRRSHTEPLRKEWPLCNLTLIFYGGSRPTPAAADAPPLALRRTAELYRWAALLKQEVTHAKEYLR